MKVGKWKEVAYTLPAGPENDMVKMRVLIGDDDNAPNFVMRHFEVLPGGSTPYHSHSWEHEVFVLSGQGKVTSEKGEISLEPGSFVLVDPEEKHNFAATGDVSLEFLCIIPREEECNS